MNLDLSVFLESLSTPKYFPLWEAVGTKESRVERTSSSSSASATFSRESNCEEPATSLYTSPFDDLSVLAGATEVSTESEKGESKRLRERSSDRSLIRLFCSLYFLISYFD